MSLLDQLREAGRNLDPQFQPSSNEISAVLGALVYYTEHGDDFLKASEDGVEGSTNLIAPPADDQDGAASAGAPTPPAAAPQSDDELRAQIADLEAQLATRQATSQQTTLAEHTNEPAAEEGP